MNRFIELAVLYTHGNMTRYMPKYHHKLSKLYNKILADGENYKHEEYLRYCDLYEKVTWQEKWKQQKQDAIVMQNNHQYFKDNPIRRCLKCGKDVLTGSGNCLQEKSVRYESYNEDLTENAYYIRDQASVRYQDMFHYMFTLCLAEYPRGDTMSYKDGLIGFNSNTE
jgi:hypothetical protein